MTTKRTTKPEAKTNGYNAQTTWRGFVNIELDKAQKESALRMTENMIDLLGAIEGAVQVGYRMSITFTPTESVYNCTLTGTDKHPTDEGIAVSARSTKVENAIAASVIKVEVAGGNLSSLFEGVQYRQTDL